MYEYNGKVYRSLEEQVQKNMDDIEELKNGIIPTPTGDWKPSMLAALASLRRIEEALLVVDWSVEDGPAYQARVKDANDYLESTIDNPEPEEYIYQEGNKVVILEPADITVFLNNHTLQIF